VFTDRELKTQQADEELKRNLFEKQDGLKQIPQYVFSKTVSDERMRNYMISELVHNSAGGKI
jgi:hypothetical protein